MIPVVLGMSRSIGGREPSSTHEEIEIRTGSIHRPVYRMKRLPQCAVDRSARFPSILAEELL